MHINKGKENKIATLLSTFPDFHSWGCKDTLVLSLVDSVLVSRHSGGNLVLRDTLMVTDAMDNDDAKGMDMKAVLGAGLKKGASRSEMIAYYKKILEIRGKEIRAVHERGAGGLEVCSLRAQMLDEVLREILTQVADCDAGELGRALPFALLATGGYGRGLLNPGSDLDLLFLLPKAQKNADSKTAALIEDILYLLWDMGFKVGHAVRNVAQSIAQAEQDPQTKCSFIEMRLIAGNAALADQLASVFRSEVILKHEAQFLDERRADLRSRQEKSSYTVFLQEPNLKQSLGGLRDYHLMRWICWVKRGTLDLRELVKEGILPEQSFKEVELAHDFLLSVRNELHYQTNSASDLLTLRLQGVIAQYLSYPQRTILRQIEAFMRDYYHHGQNLLRHSTALLESFEIEEEKRQYFSLLNFLPSKRKKGQDQGEHFDGFVALEGRMHPESELKFEDDRGRMMRLFQHSQLRGVRIAPELKALVRASLPLVDSSFRRDKTIRQTFEAILSRKGSVARALRQMHRVEFLGRYLPEFGKIDCLVQHEFFHRYTADEHTLRTIDALDSLMDSSDSELEFFRSLFRDLEDPFLFYLALLMHDAGRAEDMRQHEDGSAVLASRVCSRLGVRGQRRKLVMFLVVHHLTLFRTATMRDASDPQVVKEFAQIVETRERLDALMLFSWADAMGTSENAWSSWKEAMMRQLYRNTILWWEQREKAFTPDVQELKQQVRTQLSENYEAEIEAHFKGMPASYFRLRESKSIVGHIRLYRQFFLKQQPKRSAKEALIPAISWQDVPEAGWTVLSVCSWNRARLLTRIAAVLSSHHINILSAVIQGRGDDTALNTFRICSTVHEPISRPSLRESVERDLADLLSVNAMDLDAYLAKRKRRQTKAPKEVLGHGMPSRVLIENEGGNFTTIQIQAMDRMGLLFQIFRVINRYDLDVLRARISTEKGAAIDTIELTNAANKAVTDEQVLHSLEADLEQVIEPER